MFRRKEETALDSANQGAAVAPGAPVSNGAGQDSPVSSSVQQPIAQPSAPVSHAAHPAPAASGSTYVPTAPVSRPAAAPSEPARPATPASAYRPTPISEFNRGASRPASEPSRSTPSSSTSFGGTTEKTGVAKSNRRVLTVGNDILLKGEIATCDRLVIEGRVEAKLSEVHTVEIAECGSFKGTAEVEDAEISGVFEGDLVVRNRLVVYTSGEVRGNISYGEIEIERGGKLTGQIKTVVANAAKGRPLDSGLAPEKRKETAAA